MDFWGNLLGGFMDRKYDVEKENLRKSERQAEAERAIMSHLMTADNEEVSKLAITALLHGSDPRQKAKGFKGWIGETLASPYMSQMDTLLHSSRPVEESFTINGPGENMGVPGPIPGMPQTAPVPSITTPPPAQGAIGMPPESPVQPGAQPPTPTTWTQAPPTPMSLKRIAMRPVEAFLPPMEKYRQQAVAKESADIEGDIAALSPYIGRDAAVKEAIAFRMSRRGTAGSMGQSIAGEAPDETGGFKATFGVFDRPSQTYVYPGTQTPIPGFRPRTTTASTSMGVAVEPLAKAMFGKMGKDLSQPEMAQVLEASKLQKAILTPKDAIAAASRLLPNATVEQQFTLADALMGSTAAPVTPSAGGPPAPASAAPSQAPAATAPPVPASAHPPTVVPPKPGLAGAIPPGMADASKETGKPMPPAVARTLASAKSTNDLIDQALAALEPFKNDTSLQGALDLVSKYRQGVYNPVNGAAAQLADLAGLQTSAQAQLTGGGTRAFQFYVDRRQHVPKLPSIRQVQANTLLPAGAVQGISGLLRDDAGTFDSPQQMYEKLQRAKANNASFVEELERSTREPMKSMDTPQAGGPGTAYKDDKGVWHIRQ